jgi:hypothetical protein
VRTPLDKLDVDEATRKLLNQGGIADVEGILEADPQKLATIVGSADLAKELAEMARRLLGSTAPAAVTTTITSPVTPAPTRPTGRPPRRPAAEGGGKASGRKREPKKPK